MTTEARHLLKSLKDEGWYLGETAGASRQYVHRDEPGLITVCVRYTDPLTDSAVALARTPARSAPDGTPVIQVEASGSGFVAYSPDLSGCVATGATEAEARERMAEALALHLEGLRGG